VPTSCSKSAALSSTANPASDKSLKSTLGPKRLWLLDPQSCGSPKFIREALKIGDFPLNRCEVLGCDKVHFAAVPVGLVDKRQQSPHFVETEAKITAAAHKPPTLQMRRFIDAIVAAWVLSGLAPAHQM
jgi:hypothetical protein